jgi:hypothetical protein
VTTITTLSAQPSGLTGRGRGGGGGGGGDPTHPGAPPPPRSDPPASPLVYPLAYPPAYPPISNRGGELPCPSAVWAGEGDRPRPVARKPRARLAGVSGEADG